jgi:hypothetical protein
MTHGIEQSADQRTGRYSQIFQKVACACSPIPSVLFLLPPIGRIPDLDTAPLGSKSKLQKIIISVRTSFG